MGYEKNGYFRNGFIAVILFPLMVLFAFVHNSYAIVATGGSGVLSLSKTEAFLNEDTIIITVVDNDLNITSAADSGTVKITPASGSNIYLTMNENSSNSGTFLGTFKTASSTDDSTSPIKVRAVANGIITVMYQDASPVADITANVSTKNFGAVIDITEDQIAHGGNAVVSLYDPETNVSISSANVVNVNVKSTTDSTGTTLRLTETGNDTGSFLGTIAVSASDTLVNTRIISAVGDTITVSFTDNPDADGGISIVSDTAEVVEAGTIDSSAPSGSITINDGDIYTKTTSVTLSLSATDGTGVTGYYLSTSSTTPSSSDSSWISVSSTTSYSGSVSYTLSSGDGSKTVYVWYKDAAGNVSSTASDSITLDATAPTVSITSPTSDATYSTTSNNINLSGSASDSTSGVSSVTWSNSGGGSGMAIGTTNWSISSISLTSGSNVITVTATDSAGNTSTDTLTVTYSADTTLPTGSVNINSGASYTNSTAATLSLSATDSGGVTGYYLSTSSSTPSASASGWTTVSSTTSYSASVSYTLSSGDGSKTVYVWYKDAAGNVSSVASDFITLDTTAPTVSITNPTTDTTYSTTSSTISLDGSASDSTSGVSSVTWSNSGGGSGMAIGTTNWSISSISLTSGSNVITVTATDSAGNTSTDTLTVTYSADTTLPTGSVNINSGASYTNSTAATLSLSATDSGGVTGYYLSTSSSTPSASASGWTTVSSTTNYSASVSYTLSSGDGSKTVYVWYKDAVGNVSNSASDFITLDTTAPTVSITNPTTDTTYSTTSSTISLSGSASDSTSGVSNVAWSNSATGSSGTASGTTSWSVSNINLSEGSNSITVTATDNAGNTATDSITVTYSEPQPTPSPTPIINPPIVETASATNVSTGSATLNGTANANNSSATVWFEYGTTNGVYSLLSSTQTVNGTTDTSISISISSLSEGTMYYYRIAGQNSAGTSYGDEKNFTTESSCIDDFEPNDDFDVAYGPLESGKSYEGKLCSSSDRDYFKFELNNPDVQLMLTVPTDNDYDLYLYDSSKSEISKSANPKGTETISYNDLEAGMYYIQVSGYSGSYNTEDVYVLVGTWTAATSTTPVPTPAELGAIFGSVVDTDGKPVANATVFTNKGGYSAKNGSNGIYQLNDVAEGSYLLTALAEGYGSVSQTVTVKAGETTQADFTLLRAITPPTPVPSLSPSVNPVPSTTPTPSTLTGKIFGYVVDEYNDPVESAKVRCKGKGTGVKVKEYTNKEGYFEFNNLNADTYKIVSKKKGYYKSKYNVNLEEGEEKEIEIVLEEK